MSRTAPNFGQKYGWLVFKIIDAGVMIDDEGF